MGFLNFLKHRATRIVIEAIFLAMSAVGLFNTIANNQIDEVFVFIALFAIANTLHLIFDKLWSWLCVMPFILVYEVFLWINFLSFKHVFLHEDTMEDYIYFGIFTAGISIVLLFIIYLLKPSAEESSKEGIVLRRVFYALGGLAMLNLVFHIANFCYIAFGGHGGGAGDEGYIIGALTALLLFLVYGILLLAFRSKLKSQTHKYMRLVHTVCIANFALYLVVLAYVFIFELHW